MGQLRRAEAPGRGHRNTGFTAYTLSNRAHEGRAPWNVGVRNGKADADAQQVQATVLETAGQFDGLGEGLLITAVVFDHTEPGGERQVFRPDFTHRSQGFEEEAAAVVEAATVGIGTLVGVLGEKALAQVAVGKVQLDPFKAGIASAAGRVDEVLLHAGNVFQGHGTRYVGQVGTKRDGRGGDGFPATGIRGRDVVITFPGAIGTGFATGVGDLNARHRTCGLDGLDHGHECLGVGVAPDPSAAWGDASFRGDRGGLDHQQAGTTTGHAGQVNVVPVVDHAVFGHVLAHRWDSNAIAQGHIFEFERFEQSRH